MATASAPLTRHERLRVARLRLVAQGLLPGVPEDAEPAQTPEQVVSRLGMLQAQDLAQACWALGVRLPGSTLADVHAAFESGSIVRSWGARGTLMLLDPALLRPLLGVSAPRMRAQVAGTWRRENITDAELEALLPVVLERCGTTGASRAELMETMSNAGSDISGQRGYHLIVGMSLTGELVQGRMEPGSDTRQLFMGSGAWSPGVAPETAANLDESLKGIIVAYFASHGPATIADCAWWMGLGLTPVRAALKALEGVLAVREIAGQLYFMAPHVDALWDGALDPESVAARSLLALPGFDEFLLGYKDRSATLAQEHADAVVPGSNGVFRRILVDGGQTIGTWQLKTAGKGKAASTRGVPVPFEEIPAHQLERFDAAMNSHLRFRGF